MNPKKLVVSLKTAQEMAEAGIMDIISIKVNSRLTQFLIKLCRRLHCRWFCEHLDWHDKYYVWDESSQSVSAICLKCNKYESLKNRPCRKDEK